MKKVSKNFRFTERKDQQKEIITPEFKKWVKEFTDQHQDALRELAKR